MLIKYLFFAVCLYYTCLILGFLYKNLYSKEIKPVDSYYSSPINKRTESRVTSTTKTLVAKKSQSRETGKKVRRKDVIVKQNKAISYSSYRKNNIVKF